MAYVQYVGQKAYKIDQHFGTKCVWMGNMDIQEIADEKAAASMCALHPTIWRLVDSAAKMGVDRAPEGDEDDRLEFLDTVMVQEPTGAVVTLASASRNAIAKYASDAMGLNITDAQSREEILTEMAKTHKLIHDLGKEAAPKEAEPKEAAPASGSQSKPKPKPKKKPSPKPKGYKMAEPDVATPINPTAEEAPETVLPAEQSIVPKHGRKSGEMGPPVPDIDIGATLNTAESASEALF